MQSIDDVKKTADSQNKLLQWHKDLGWKLNWKWWQTNKSGTVLNCESTP